MKRSPKHLAFIRTLPCAKCGTPGPNQAAHIRIGTQAGMGLKPADSFTVPLCWACHDKQHRVGERTFWGEDDPRELASDLWGMTGDTKEASWKILTAVIERVMR